MHKVNPFGYCLPNSLTNNPNGISAFSYPIVKILSPKEGLILRGAGDIDFALEYTGEWLAPFMAPLLADTLHM